LKEEAKKEADNVGAHITWMLDNDFITADKINNTTELHPYLLCYDRYVSCLPNTKKFYVSNKEFEIIKEAMANQTERHRQKILNELIDKELKNRELKLPEGEPIPTTWSGAWEAAPDAKAV
jgi:hypothetical protein